MLKGIPHVISPELMHVLMSMGHGDTIVLADGNFPAASIAENTPGGLVRSDGYGVPELLVAILKLLPLDTYVGKGESPVMLMQVVEGDKSVHKGEDPEIWYRFLNIIRSSDPRSAGLFLQMLERHAFYEKARQAFAVVATSERALYANIILQKGVVAEAE